MGFTSGFKSCNGWSSIEAQFGTKGFKFAAVDRKCCTANGKEARAWALLARGLRVCSVEAHSC